MKLSIMAFHNQASLAFPELQLSSMHLQGFLFFPVCWTLYFQKAPCAREACGKMQRDFIEHEKGKSFITVECSFASVWKAVFILSLGNSYSHALVQVM